jgi:hypothetical protein
VKNIWNEYFAGSEAVFGYFERLAVSKKEGRAVRGLFRFKPITRF